jgi:segregation and condensation protein B
MPETRRRTVGNKCVARKASMTQTPALDPSPPNRMAFNLQKVLRALLFASSGPLTIKEIQDTLTRFHAQEAELLAKMKPEVPSAESPAEVPAAVPAAEEQPVAIVEGMPVGEGAPGSEVTVPADPAAEVTLGLTSAETDAEYYQEVPSLITASQIREAMDAIAAELRAREEVFFLIEGSNGYRLVTNPKAARWVRLLRDEPPPVRLSQAALETLAVIAYRQPVTRGEIETIRGVSAEAGVNKLLERGLIYVAGRAELPGRPIQFGTTDEFLEFVGIKSLAELPASDVLSNRQIDEWLQQSENPAHMADKDVGLQTDELPLDPAEEPIEETPPAAPAEAASAAPASAEPSVPDHEPAVSPAPAADNPPTN